MDCIFLGKLIEYERTIKNISSSKLTKGVCSVAVLHRLEYGKRLPSFFILERLLERLGKSVNKIEFLYDEMDYEIYCLREQIEDKIEEKKLNEAQEALEYYISMIKDFYADRMDYSIHSQYIDKIRAILAIFREEYEKAEKLLLKSIIRTVPDFKNYIEKSKGDISIYRFLKENIIGEEEVILLLLWIQIVRPEKYDSTFGAEGKTILKYIDRVCDDEEVKANVYSKAAWIFSGIALRNHDLKGAYRYILEGERILTDNGLLLYLPQFLDRILLLSYQLEEETYYSWRLQRDALKQLYEEFGKKWEEEEPCIWRSHRQKELYLVSELLGQERRLSEKSQEEMAYEMQIDLKTMNRLEKGRFKPRPGTLRKVKDYLMIDRDICSTRIVVEDFALLEMEREIAKLNNRRREKEAEVIYKRLKKNLSPIWKANRQYMVYMDMLFDHQLNRISTKDALEACKEAFIITREQLEWEQIDEIIPSRQECFILNYAAKCYDELMKKEKAIALLEGIVRGYEKSKVDLKYHHTPLSLIYEHLSIDCEETGRLEEAIVWCNKAITFDLTCNRGGNLGFILEQKVYTQDRIERKNREIDYLQAYYLLKLMKQNKRMMDLQSNYFKCYGKVLVKL